MYLRLLMSIVWLPFKKSKLKHGNSFKNNNNQISDVNITP
ncbi:MAG: hypothetical protein OFPII_28390 [Osedax symbiont Rs1]|nr:MAG: hypothetical protein OFPII_28390 [Osedax symbiont Rs1]